MAKYEALLGGLRLSHAFQARWISVYCDSHIIVSQVQGTFQAKEEVMQNLLASAKQLIGKFKYFQIMRIPISKLTSLPQPHPRRKIIVKEIFVPRILKTSVNHIDEVRDKWMTPIKEYLLVNTLHQTKRYLKRSEWSLLSMCCKMGWCTEGHTFNPYWGV